MIFLTEPENFEPHIEVVGCYVEFEGKILMLHRHDHKPQGGTWDSSGGKIHSLETPLETIEREIKEETGISIYPNKLEYFRKFYVKYPDLNFIYHVFHYELPEKTNVTVNSNEHSEFVWVTPQEALKMKLIPDEDYCMKLYFKDRLQ